MNYKIGFLWLFLFHLSKFRRFLYSSHQDTLNGRLINKSSQQRYVDHKKLKRQKMRDDLL